MIVIKNIQSDPIPTSVTEEQCQGHVPRGPSHRDPGSQISIAGALGPRPLLKEEALRVIAGEMLNLEFGHRYFVDGNLRFNERSDGDISFGHGHISAPCRDYPLIEAHDHSYAVRSPWGVLCVPKSLSCKGQAFIAKVSSKNAGLRRTAAAPKMPPIIVSLLNPILDVMEKEIHDRDPNHNSGAGRYVPIKVGHATTVMADSRDGRTNSFLGGSRRRFVKDGDSYQISAAFVWIIATPPQYFGKVRSLEKRGGSRDLQTLLMMKLFSIFCDVDDDVDLQSNEVMQSNEQGEVARASDEMARVITAIIPEFSMTNMNIFKNVVAPDPIIFLSHKFVDPLIYEYRYLLMRACGIAQSQERMMKDFIINQQYHGANNRPARTGKYEDFTHFIEYRVRASPLATAGGPSPFLDPALTQGRMLDTSQLRRKSAAYLCCRCGLPMCGKIYLISLVYPADPNVLYQICMSCYANELLTMRNRICHHIIVVDSPYTLSDLIVDCVRPNDHPLLPEILRAVRRSCELITTKDGGRYCDKAMWRLGGDYLAISGNISHAFISSGVFSTNTSTKCVNRGLASALDDGLKIVRVLAKSGL